jgi:hypothetical protein
MVLASDPNGVGLGPQWCWPRTPMVLASDPNGVGLGPQWCWPRTPMVLASDPNGVGLGPQWCWPRTPFHPSRAARLTGMQPRRQSANGVGLPLDKRWMLQTPGIPVHQRVIANLGLEVHGQVPAISSRGMSPGAISPMNSRVWITAWSGPQGGWDPNDGPPGALAVGHRGAEADELCLALGPKNRSPLAELGEMWLQAYPLVAAKVQPAEAPWLCELICFRSDAGMLMLRSLSAYPEDVDLTCRVNPEMVLQVRVDLRGSVARSIDPRPACPSP